MLERRGRPQDRGVWKALTKRKSKSRARGEAAIAVPVSYPGDDRSPPAERASRERALARAEPNTSEPAVGPPAGPPADTVSEAPANGQPPAAAMPEVSVGQVPNLPPEPEPQAADPAPVQERQVENLPPETRQAEGQPREAAPAAVPVAIPVILPPQIPSAVTTLEMRVRRLEDALAQWQELRAREAREARAGTPPAGQVQCAPPAPKPASTTSLLLDVGKRLLQPSEPVAPAAATPAREGRRGLLGEAIAEARAIVRMYVDPRYRLSWFGRVVPLGLIALIATSQFWGCVLGTALPLGIGTLLDKAVDLVLAFVLFKVLGQEARRYRETSPDLPPNLRL